MDTILERILQVKRKEVEEMKKVKRDISFTKQPKRVFIQKLKEATEISIIAEFKRASPSKGNINLEKSPGEQAKTYEDGGVDAISVLTDHTFFKGSFTDLQTIRNTVKCPILCKDFIIDPIQIDFAKKAGADIILLIAAALDKHKLYELYQYACEQELEVLMEVHNEKEAETVLRTGNRLIGVNNRNLKTFEVNLQTTELLAPLIKREGAYLISESGMKTKEDVKRVMNVGANGILVGETFMKHDKLHEVLNEMKLPIHAGLRS